MNNADRARVSMVIRLQFLCDGHGRGLYSQSRVFPDSSRWFACQIWALHYQPLLLRYSFALSYQARISGHPSCSSVSSDADHDITCSGNSVVSNRNEKWGDDRHSSGLCSALGPSSALQVACYD